MSIKTAQTLVSEAMQEIKTISVEEAYKVYEENNCNLIDIRDTVELQREGSIKNSFHISRGLLEFAVHPDSPYAKKEKLDPNKELVLFCAAGGRSALAAKTLKEMGFEKVSHIDGGFAAMKNSGFETS